MGISSFTALSDRLRQMCREIFAPVRIGNPRQRYDAVMFNARSRLYAVQLLDMAGPFLPLSALWFTTTLTVAESSVVFAVWSVVALLAEVPTGVLADRVSRRVVLTAGWALRALGLTLFVVWPTLWGFLLGASFWAIQLALHSGAWESLVYDVVDADEGSYQHVSARLGQLEQVGAVGALALGFVWMEAGGGMTALAAMTVVLQLPLVGLLWQVDEPARVPAPKGVGGTVSHALTQLGMGGVGLLLLLGAAVEASSEVDEYVPALSVALGVPHARVPLCLLAMWVGLFLGGEAAVRWQHPRATRLGIGLSLVGVAAIAALSTGTWLGLVGLMALFAVYNLAWIVLDASLQHRLEDTSRATVTSLRALLATVGASGVFALVGVLATPLNPTPGLVWALCLPVGAGVVLLMLRTPLHRAD